MRHQDYSSPEAADTISLARGSFQRKEQNIKKSKTSAPIQWACFSAWAHDELFSFVL